MTNPACGANTTGWSAAGCTLSRLTGLSTIPRTEGARGTITGTATATLRFLSAAGDIAPGQKLYVSSYIRCSSTARQIGTIVDWENNGSYVSTSTGTFAAVATANTWFRRSEALTAPAAINQWQVTIQVNTPAVNDTIDVTCVMVDMDTVLNAYADGETNAWQWKGTRYNSLSQALPMGQPKVLLQAVQHAANW
jgi:hypothetical protein